MQAHKLSLDSIKCLFAITMALICNYKIKEEETKVITYKLQLYIILLYFLFIVDDKKSRTRRKNYCDCEIRGGCVCVCVCGGGGGGLRILTGKSTLKLNSSAYEKYGY